MENNELENVWKSYDQKVERLLVINRDIAINLSRQKLSKQIGRLYRPKWAGVVIGIPYTLILIAITIIGVLSKAYFVAIGFGAISLIMASVLLHYFHQIYLVRQVKNSDGILSTQEQLSKLRTSSFNSLNIAIFQLPFWSICWMSVDVLKESPFIYGGVNLLIFAFLAYLAYWFYQKLSYKNEDPELRDFFLSGIEWEPIDKSAEILEQIKEYAK